MEQTALCDWPPLQGTYGELTKEQEHALRARQGRPHVLADMRIVDDSGKELPMDGKAAGEVQVRGPTIMNSYFKVSTLCGPQCSACGHPLCGVSAKAQQPADAALYRRAGVWGFTSSQSL